MNKVYPRVFVANLEGRGYSVAYIDGETINPMSDKASEDFLDGFCRGNLKPGTN